MNIRTQGTVVRRSEANISPDFIREHADELARNGYFPLNKTGTLMLVTAGSAVDTRILSSGNTGSGLPIAAYKVDGVEYRSYVIGNKLAGDIVHG